MHTNTGTEPYITRPQLKEKDTQKLEMSIK